jgi:two-component system, chemotaxis family, chemotaxis protein CheY
MQKTVLIVDDDPKIRKALSLRLKSSGYDILTAPNGSDALTLAGMKELHLIITDIWMPVGMGFSLAYRLKQLASRIPIIFITASKQPGLKETAKEFGAAAFIEKPYDPEMLLATISQVLESYVPTAEEQRPDVSNGKEW